jgi:hypothetical protein
MLWFAVDRESREGNFQKRHSSPRLELMAWCVGKESGINKASRELCMGKDEAHHATKIRLPRDEEKGQCHGRLVKNWMIQGVAHGPQKLQPPHKPPRHEKNADTNSDGEQHREHCTAHPAEPVAAIAIYVFFISLSVLWI